MGLIIYTIFAIIAAWLFIRWQTRASISLALKMPHDRLQLLLGWGPIQNSDTLQAYEHKLAKKYGPNIMHWAGPVPIFFTSDPQTLQDILKSKNCVNKPSIGYNGIALAVGSGLLIQPDPIWSQHRKIFENAFTSKTLKSYIPVFQNEIFNAIKSIDKKMALKEPINMSQIIKEINVSIGAKTTLNCDYKNTGHNITRIVKHSDSVAKYAVDATFNYFGRIKLIRYLAESTEKVKQTRNDIEKLVKDSIEIYKSNLINNPGYLSDIKSSLDCGFSALQQNLLTAEELNNQLYTIFVSSFETTSNGIFLVICMLAMHSEYQERAYNEVLSVLSDGDSDGVTLTYEQINQLVYLEMIINETMRLFPFVGIVARTVSNDSLKLSNGLVLPIGQAIGINIYSLHRNKAVYGPEADCFNPENFSPEKLQQRHPYSFIPFTKGQRNCIGWRYAYILMKMVLAQFIRNYKFDTDFKIENLRFVNRITIHLVEEPKINIERRNVQNPNI